MEITQIIGRKEAHMQGLTKYYTGKPCTHGHITYRYVQSGSCARCVAAAAEVLGGGIREDKKAERVRRIDMIDQLVEIRVRVFLVDWPVIRETAVQLCIAKFPELTPQEVIVRRSPTDIQQATGLYRVVVPPEHAELMQSTAVALFNSRCGKVDIQAARARILKEVCAIADTEGSCPE